MKGRYLSPLLLALAVTLVPVSAEAEAQAVGVRCADVTAGGYRATHVFADFMPCRSARTKLRRWLRRNRLPRNRDGWHCYRLSGSVRACTFPGKRGLGDPKSFTFWLGRASRARAAARIRECGDVNRHIYNVTTRVVPCRFARRFAAPRHHGPGLRRGSLLPLPGMALPQRGLPHPARLRGRLALHARRRSRGALPVRRRRMRVPAVYAAWRTTPRSPRLARPCGRRRGPYACAARPAARQRPDAGAAAWRPRRSRPGAGLLPRSGGGCLWPSSGARCSHSSPPLITLLHGRLMATATSGHGNSSWCDGP
jgi:hypothetical protein